MEKAWQVALTTDVTCSEPATLTGSPESFYTEARIIQLVGIIAPGTRVLGILSRRHFDPPFKEFFGCRITTRSAMTITST